MDKVKAALLILTLILLGSTPYLLVQRNTAQAAAEGAQELAAATKDLLRLQDVRCSKTSPEDIATECIRPLLAARDFREDAFRQPKGAEPGYLVIKNMGRTAYEAGKFSFQFNRAPIQEGCTVAGTIDYEVTCRFEFAQECRDGDVLEVFYPVADEPVRVFLKTC